MCCDRQLISAFPGGETKSGGGVLFNVLRRGVPPRRNKTQVASHALTFTLLHKALVKAITAKNDERMVRINKKQHCTRRWWTARGASDDAVLSPPPPNARSFKTQRR